MRDRTEAADQSGHVPGRYQTPLGEGRVRCEVCPRQCTLRPGQRAFCFVRQGVEDGIALTTYGRSSGFCIDPIEKKPLNHFYPGSSVLSFGTAGCNLGCKFCQNWDISKARQMDRLQDRASPSDIARVAKERGCKSAAFTYNDPTIFIEYAVDTAEACRESGVHPVAVTAGYIAGRAREDFFSAMDATNIDLKSFDNGFYRKLCLAELGPVLETIAYVHAETSCWLELTTLLIPDANDSTEELTALCRWVADTLGPDVPLHFTAYHPDFRLRDKERTPGATLTRARRIGHDHGLHFVYTGNVHDSQGGSTSCPDCGELLIARDWFALGHYGLNHNRCRGCNRLIPGHFSKDGPEDFGRRRIPLRMVSA